MLQRLKQKVFNVMARYFFCTFLCHIPSPSTRSLQRWKYDEQLKFTYPWTKYKNKAKKCQNFFFCFSIRCVYCFANLLRQKMFQNFSRNRKISSNFLIIILRNLIKDCMKRLIIQRVGVISTSPKFNKELMIEAIYHTMYTVSNSDHQ